MSERISAPDPGVYQNIPASIYHSWEAVSSTFIKGFALNPFAAKNVPFKDTPSTILGSACHVFTLEGRDAFNKEYFVLEDIPCPEGQNPKGWKNTNLYKEKKQIQELEADGRTVLTSEQGEKVRGVDRSLREHPTTSKMLNRGFNELSLVWIDESTGMKCKARLDDYFNGIPSDLKTCNDVEWFHRDIYRMRYNLQGGHYFTGAEVCGLNPPYFCFLAAQTDETYPVRCGYIDPDKMTVAVAEVHRLLGLIRECQERDFWPNYRLPAEVHTLDQWEKISASALLEEW